MRYISISSDVNILLYWHIISLLFLLPFFVSMIAWGMGNAYIVLQTGWVQVSVAMLGLGVSLMEPSKRSWIILTCVVFLILLLVHCVHSLFLGTVWGPARDQYFVRDLTLWGYLAICITFGAALPLRFGDSMVRNISSLSIDYGVRSVKCSPGEQNVWINLGGVFLGCVFKFCAGILHLLFMLCFLDFAFKFVAA